MEALNIKYPTTIRHHWIGKKLFVLEAIRDLDEAIELICETMSPDEKRDPFAEDLCPYFGVLWESSIALADFLGSWPQLVSGKSVLELGAGLGLPSLVASHFGGKVLATDFHPGVEAYFKRNCAHSNVPCAYHRLNWREQELSQGQFDVVIGSDILYESRHPQDVAKGLLRFVKPNGKIILSDPGRSYFQKFIEAMNQTGHPEELTTVNVKGKEIFIVTFDAG
ncbi:MAG TPA: methyltransferase domain-containing protein [Bacteriovoracaceae bacterium]|nr:methyltransferase domain-containing protein [Bacteriovoracaceae bacterium]